MLTVTASEQHLLARMADARAATDALFDLLEPAALYDRPIAERHRVVFYLGHLEAFDWNLLNDFWIGAPRFAPEHDKLFAFGIDPLGDGLPTDTAGDWPPLDQIRAYRDLVRDRIDAALQRPGQARAAGTETAQCFSFDQLMSVAIEHRLMHAETLAYMLHRMPFDMKIAPPRSALEEPVPGRFMPPTSGGDNVLVPRGPAFIGMPRSAGRFGWDNEYDGIEVDVPAFRIGRHMVTNGQFAEFVAAGGYRERRYWKDDDWTWKERALIEHPVFWQRANDSSEWRLRTMFEAIRLPRNWPVYASHAEAAAYACWAGQALPTEAQWQRAATGARDWGDAVAAKVPEKGNFDCVRWDPTPVDAAHHPESAFGAIGMFGNGWEWTSTPFAALPGFKRFEFYKGYSADFFDGRHFVMKGGSPRTAACMVRPAFRNWFQAHYQYAYAGFRCVTAIA